MIRVNLLRDQTLLVRKMAVGPTVSSTGLVLLAIFVILVGGLGSWWFYVDHQVRLLTEARDRLRVENERLQALKKQISEFEKLKQLHQSRIDVIERLKENQTGPVLLLNDVVQSVPRDASLWLTQLEQKADRIRITGFTRRGEDIPDFMTNLSATGIFKSVDLELVEEAKEASKFSLLCVRARQ